MDVAVFGDHKIKWKESENVQKHWDAARKLKNCGA